MWENRIKTVLLLGSLSGILLLIGRLFGGTTGLTIALVIAVVMNIFAYFFSDKMVLRMYNAQPLNPQEYADIYTMVQQLCTSMKMPMPKLYLINTPMANAFATGRNPSNASVAVTTGILKILTPQELRGVLAHELSHVQNRDILVSTIAATLATAIGYLANMMQQMAYWGALSSSNDERRRGNPIFMIFVAILMPIAASLIQLAISRSREFMADETGAHICKDPLALAGALQKLQSSARSSHLNDDDTAHASTAPLFIVHPFSSETVMSLFATHPPIAQRVARLQRIYEKMF